MGTPFSPSCSLAVSLFFCVVSPVFSQVMLRPDDSGQLVHPLPSDVVILESDESRKEIPCTVTPRKSELGFDLRFHSGYDVTVPLRELSGQGGTLSIIFRVAPDEDRNHATYFVQHFHVPPIDEEAKGEALLDGSVDVGEGTYHVDWLMRDQAEHICSASWTTEASLAPKDKPISLFIHPKEVLQSASEPFVNDSVARANIAAPDDALNLKLLVNFAPQNFNSAALQRTDTEALVSILKAIERDPHVAHIALVAFNIQEGKIVYRQDAADSIDFLRLERL